METKGRIVSIQQTFPQRKTLVTIEIETAPVQAETLKDKILSIALKQWRDKRSNRANQYYWELVGKLAKAVGTSETEQHNHLLADYGTYADEDTSWFPESFDWTRVKPLEKHYRPTGEREMIRGEWKYEYMALKGSHEYDTAEMSRLIEGVVYEAQEMGIETLPPDEIARMTAAWRAR